MSNSNTPKAAMMAVVSAAQKSVNHNSVANHNNTLSKNTGTIQNMAQNKTSENNKPSVQKNSSVTPQSDSQIVTPQKSQEKIEKALNEVIQYQDKIISEKEIDTKTQKEQEISQDAKKTLTETAQKTLAQTQKQIDFNQHIVSLLCDGIRNTQNQTFDFTEKLQQNRTLKKQSLTHIQAIACDNFQALSNTCIDVAQKSLKTVNPLDLIKNQTQGITQIHKVYANMVSTLSQASLDIIKQNCTFSWFYNISQNKK